MVTTGQERHSTIAIGDIHGLDKWKAVVDAHPDSRIVFLGDYLDPYDDISHADMLANFSEIMELKRSRPEDVVLLLGNHDIHYFNSYAAVGSRYDLELVEVFADIFLDNLYLFQNAYQEGNVVFPTTRSAEHMRENLDVFDFELSDDEMARVNALPQRPYYVVPEDAPDFVLVHNDYSRQA